MVIDEISNVLILKKIENKKDVEDILVELGEIDADFCGDNGEEYLWDEAEGYDSNARYLAHIVTEKTWTGKNDMRIEHFIRCFINEFQKRDSYWDLDFRIQKLEQDKGFFNTYAVSFIGIPS